MKNLNKLLVFIKPYWKAAVLASLFLTAVVVMDLVLPHLIQRIIDDGINKSDLRVVLTSSLIMIVASLFSVIFAVGNTILAVRVGEGFSRDLRQAIFLKIQSLSFANLNRLQTGNRIVCLTSDVNMVKMVMQMFLRIGARAPLLMVRSIALMVMSQFKGRPI